MRTGKSLRLILVTALLVAGMVVSAGVPASATVVAGHPINLTKQFMPQNRGDIDGSIAVWQDGRYGTCGDVGSAWSIWMHDFATGVDKAVSTAPKKQENPRVDGDNIVYQSDEDCDGSPGGKSSIYLYDYYSDETTAIAFDEEADQEYPDVCGDIIVWEEYVSSVTNGWDICGYDLGTGEEIDVCSADNGQHEPRVSGDIVVWEDYRDDGDGDIWGYDLAEEDEFEICTDGESQWNPVIEGDTVAWIDHRDDYDAIYTYDLVTDTESEVVTSTASINDLEIGDGILVWSDTSTGDGDVYMYDLESGEKTQVTDADYCDGMPAISNGIVLYNHYIEADEAPDMFAIALQDIPVAYSTVAGATRYETAVENSKKAFYNGADTVVIATGANWPDAMGASSLAGAYDAPILLTQPDVLPAAVADEIERLGAADVFVIGGTSAVADSVEDELAGLVSGDVVRLGGADRYETAELVAAEAVAANPEWDGTAFITTGLNFPDALSASPLAAFTGWPIFLSGADGLSTDTQDAMDDLGVGSVLLLGGTGVVPDSVATAADSERLGGINRYGTAVAIAQYGVTELGMTWGSFGLATGEDFPDALSAGAALGRKGFPLLLTPAAYLDSTTAGAIASIKLDAVDVWFIGGTNAISQDVRDEVMSMIP